jgi:hypothetical protein
VLRFEVHPKKLQERAPVGWCRLVTAGMIVPAEIAANHARFTFGALAGTTIGLLK